MNVVEPSAPSQCSSSTVRESTVDPPVGVNARLWKPVSSEVSAIYSSPPTVAPMRNCTGPRVTLMRTACSSPGSLMETSWVALALLPRIACGGFKISRTWPHDRPTDGIWSEVFLPLGKEAYALLVHAVERGAGDPACGKGMR